MTKLTHILAIVLLTFSTISWAGNVNINTADAKTLAAGLKGIGDKKAAAIVAYRKQHGAFKHIEDLAKVKGIGDKILKNNRSMLKLSGKSALDTKKSVIKKAKDKTKTTAKTTKDKAKTTAKATKDKSKTATKDKSKTTIQAMKDKAKAATKAAKDKAKAATKASAK